MQIAFSSKTFPKLSILESIDAIAFAGYEGIEIWANPPHAYPVHMTFHEVARIRRRLNMAGVSVCCVDASHMEALGDGCGPSWNSTDRLSRETRLFYTIECIRMASMLESPYVCIGCGGPGGLSAYWDALKNLEEGLYVALEHAEEYGVQLLIEPMPGGLIENVEDIARIIERIDSKAFGVCLDLGNLVCVEDDPGDAIRRFEEQLRYTRIGDISASRVPYSVLPGDGAVDFPQIMEALEEIGYEDYLCLSLSPGKRAPMDLASVALERMVRMTGQRFLFE